MPYIGLSGVSPAKAFGWGAYQASSDSGAYFPLQIITVGGSGASSINFNNIPTTTYSNLQLRIFGRTDRSGNTQDTISIRFNSDSGNNYSRHMLFGDGSGGPVSTDSATSANLMVVSRFSGATATSTRYGSGIVDIFDYKNTNKYKIIKSLGGIDLNGSGEVYFASGAWMNTNAITSIQVISNTGSNFVQESVFALYGVK